MIRAVIAARNRGTRCEVVKSRVKEAIRRRVGTTRSTKVASVEGAVSARRRQSLVEVLRVVETNLEIVERGLSRGGIRAYSGAGVSI